MNSKSDIEKGRLELQVETTDKNKKYFQIRYWQDIIMVVIVLTSITILASMDSLGQATVGTLLGTVIGYALGRFKGKLSWIP